MSLRPTGGGARRRERTDGAGQDTYKKIVRIMLLCPTAPVSRFYTGTEFKAPCKIILINKNNDILASGAGHRRREWSGGELGQMVSIPQYRYRTFKVSQSIDRRVDGSVLT